MSRNEAQTRRDLIDPVLFQRGWTNDLVKVEVTPGGVDIVDGKPRRRKGRSDYLLCLPVLKGQPPLPVAILEAKKEDSIPSLGLQQAQGYAERFNVLFAFSTNGSMFTGYGKDDGVILTADRLGNFPSPDDLRRRYEAYQQFQLNSKAARSLLMKYKSGESSRFYFQDAAIRAVLEKIARGGTGCNRILLSLATGTGKTFIAKELLWKMAQAGQLRRALFLCDRDELRSQALTNLQGVFGDDAQAVTTAQPKTNAKVLVSTYHTLNITNDDSEPKFWKENFPPNFFSHIIIDECHRSAWGKWSIVLTDNPDAIQIGLTATPRRITPSAGGAHPMDDERISANNLDYFGAPVYEYTIAEAQEDGYLAACEVVRRFVDVDARILTREEIAAKSVTFALTGETALATDIGEKYASGEFERSLALNDRVNAMCEDLFQLLLDTGGPHQKTIIFCAGDFHAGEVFQKMHNLYNDWCRRNGAPPRQPYAFKVTAKEGGSRDFIAELKGSNNSHFIATTVELLSTGVDVPNLQNVVFFKYLSSPISFYQMVGRGTRPGEPRGSKLMFRLYDYTNATRLFGRDFVSKPTPSTSESEPDGSQVQRKILRVGDRQFEVQVQDSGRAVLCEEDGRDVLVPYETYKERLATRLAESVSDLDALRQAWAQPQQRRELLASLPGGEGAVRLVRALEDADDCDLYDILAMLGFGYLPRTRAERAGGFAFRNRSWLRQYPDTAQAVLLAIVNQFQRGGIEELEDSNIFTTSEVKTYGGWNALAGLPVPPKELILETKMRLLA